MEKNYSEIFRRMVKIGGILFFTCIIIIFGMNIIGLDILSKFFSQGLEKYRLEINLYLVMKSLATVCIVIHPLFLAMGYIKEEIKIISIANLLYLIILFVFIKKFALIGVILAYGIQVLLIVVMKSLIIYKYSGTK